LTFSVYLEGDEPTTLSIIFDLEDGETTQFDYEIDNNNTWKSTGTKFYKESDMTIVSRIRNPVGIAFIKGAGGSNIIIDNIVLKAGEYFKHFHLLGTNWRSHDLLSKLFYGSRVSLIVSVGAIILSMVIGIPFGMVAGYFRGKVDQVIMRITDIFLTLPFYFVMIIVIVVLQDTPALDNLIIRLGLTAEVIIVSVTVGLGIFGWMGMTRLIRATILQIREMDYVEAARALGASNRRIMIVHILPNILAPLIVVVTYLLAVNIVAEAGLAFLGFTDQSLASWGRELDDGVTIVSVAWWPVLFPAIFIIVAVLAFNLLGDGMRDAFDPRLR
jgi:ABC-type dipeptide/oligopeptide/nickel transport system permease subunit